MKYDVLRIYNKKEIDELIKRAAAIESPVAVDTDEMRVIFRSELAKIPIELVEVEVLREVT